MAALCPIMDPEYNKEKICKEMILLEDHLFKPCERCRDCVRKHLLKIDALAEEMGSLDKTGRYAPLAGSLSAASRTWLAEVESLDFDSGSATKALHKIGQRIRRCRKKLVSNTFNQKRETMPSHNGNGLTLEEEVESEIKIAQDTPEAPEGVPQLMPAWADPRGYLEQGKGFWRGLPQSYKTVIGTGSALLAGAWLLK